MAKYDKHGTVIILSTTGRELDLVYGVIGIDDQGKTFTGYDDQLPVLWPNLTPEEKLELADFMIERWQAYKNAANARSVKSKE